MQIGLTRGRVLYRGGHDLTIIFGTSSMVAKGTNGVGLGANYANYGRNEILICTIFVSLNLLC